MNITVIKQDERGNETWRYQGVVLERRANAVILEAYFNYKRDVDLHGLRINIGDRLLETFYSDRWYNIFEVYSQQDERLKGWYCNIGMPAEISQDELSYRDLALDLIVFPDGKQILLDEDEFEALELSPNQRAQARSALAELRSYFDKITGAP